MMRYFSLDQLLIAFAAGFLCCAILSAGLVIADRDVHAVVKTYPERYCREGN